MKTKCFRRLGVFEVVGLVLIGLFPSLVLADVLGMWNFNNRIPPGSTNPLTGNYPTIVTNDERGPDLQRLNPTVPRSDLENDFPPYSLARETLRLSANSGVIGTATNGAPLNHRSYGMKTNFLPASASFTWEVVVAVHSYGGSGGQSVILDNTSGLWQSYDYGPAGSTISRLALEPLSGSNYNIRWVVPLNNNGGRTWLRNSALTLNLGKYYHIAAVYDEANTRARLYVNGVLIAQNNSITLAGNRSTGFALGTTGPEALYGSQTLPSFHGNFDAIAFSNDVRGPGTFMIPEPSTVALLGVGGGLFWWRHRRESQNDCGKSC